MSLQKLRQHMTPAEVARETWMADRVSDLTAPGAAFDYTAPALILEAMTSNPEALKRAAGVLRTEIRGAEAFGLVCAELIFDHAFTKAMTQAEQEWEATATQEPAHAL